MTRNVTQDLAELDRLAILFFEKCKEVFPCVNGVGNWIMGTDKVHFMIHAASEIMKWGSIINSRSKAKTPIRAQVLPRQ